MARSGDGEWVVLGEACDPGEKRWPVRQYQPRTAQFPNWSHVEISNENDAERAASDQVARIEDQGFKIDGKVLQCFYRLLASLQTTQYRTFSALLYWRNAGPDDLQETEVFCSDILVALDSETTGLATVGALAESFLRRFRTLGMPTSMYRQNSILVRPMLTVFATKIDPRPMGYSVEIKILGGGASKLEAVEQWARAVELAALQQGQAPESRADDQERDAGSLTITYPPLLMFQLNAREDSCLF